MPRPWHERFQTFLVLGLLLVAGSGFVWWDLGDLEEHGGSRSIHWIGAVLYDLGGKWLLSGVVLAVGVFLTVVGLRRRRAQRASS